MSVPLPAAADLPEPPGYAGQAERQAAQQDHGGQNQDQDECGGHVEVVLCKNKGVIPPVEERVGGGHEQGTVTKRRLRIIRQTLKKKLNST